MNQERNRKDLNNMDLKEALGKLSGNGFDRIMEHINYQNLVYYIKQDESFWDYLYAYLNYQASELQLLVYALKELHDFLYLAEETDEKVID